MFCNELNSCALAFADASMTVFTLSANFAAVALIFLKATVGGRSNA
jgi:hypothetical protein